VTYTAEKNIIGDLKTNGMEKIAEYQYHLGAFNKEKPRVETLERIPNGQRVAYPSLSSQVCSD
jgi:hypothetical protein